MTRLFLEDERDPREWLPHMRWFRGRDLSELDEWTWVKTSPEAIAVLDEDDVLEVSLDHDLGEEGDVGTGYDVVLCIEERVALDPDYEPPIIHVHTSNVGARDRMEAAVRGIESMLARRDGMRGSRLP